MIIDNMKNWNLYIGIESKIKMALEYAVKTDLTSLETGTYELCGRDLYMMIQEYDTKPFEQGRWEAHRKYIDIQYVIHGTESFGYANVKKLLTGAGYDESMDKEILEGQGEFFTLSAGEFAIFMPEDAHMPCLCAEKCEKVKKAVFKVKVHID